MKDAPTSYSELAGVLDALPLLARETRRARQLSIRGAAKEIGISYSVLSRFESGRGIHTRNAATILRWMGKP